VKNIAIFASGSGTNAAKIMAYFAPRADVSVQMLVCNKAGAGVLGIAEQYGVDTLLIDRKSFYETDDILSVLEKYDIALIVLAGFMWLAPSYLVETYVGRILNIHPALLPKYGGKGMYGMHVHEAVKAAGESQSGITIHYVNERYDEGQILFQATCALDPLDTPTDIARKVQALEHRHYPEVIDRILANIQ
jgi:phosphoribosylglycinamide formyltransferase 1